MSGLVLLVGSAASAQTPEETALARTLFHEGVELAEAENWSEAADRFRRAHALRPSAIIAFNLSLADVEIGRLVEASEMLEWVVRQEDTDEAMRADAGARLEILRPRLARLTVRVEGSEGVQVTLDERELPHAALGVAMPVDPGLHRLQLSRASEVVLEEERSVVEGEAAEWSVTAPPPPPDPAELARAEEERRRAEEEQVRREAEAREEAARILAAEQERERRTRRRRRAVGVTVAIVVAGGILGAALGVRASRQTNGVPDASLGTVDWR